MWIEILYGGLKMVCLFVTPFAGVWIEISALPSPQRGEDVTPFAGVWIEI